MQYKLLRHWVEIALTLRQKLCRSAAQRTQTIPCSQPPTRTHDGQETINMSATLAGPHSKQQDASTASEQAEHQLSEMLGAAQWYVRPSEEMRVQPEGSRSEDAQAETDAEKIMAEAEAALARMEARASAAASLHTVAELAISEPSTPPMQPIALNLGTCTKKSRIFDKEDTSSTCQGQDQSIPDVLDNQANRQAQNDGLSDPPPKNKRRGPLNKDALFRSANKHLDF